MTVYFQCRKPELQQAAQQMEILFSNDFKNMSLAELKTVRDQYLLLHESIKNTYGSTIDWSNTQYKAWQYMHQRITEEENKNDSVKLGDVFHTSWGYDQTNTEFFKVIEISKTGKTCKVVEIAPVSIGDEHKNARNMSDSVIPDPDTIINNTPCTVKIERAHNRNPFNNKIVEIGEIQLRGSVTMGKGTDKHLHTLYRVKGECSRSWYA